MDKNGLKEPFWGGLGGLDIIWESASRMLATQLGLPHQFLSLTCGCCKTCLWLESYSIIHFSFLVCWMTCPALNWHRPSQKRVEQLVCIQDGLLAIVFSGSTVSWFTGGKLMHEESSTSSCLWFSFLQATYTTLHYPARVASGRGLQLVHRHRFLFQRFKTERYYYGCSAVWFMTAAYCSYGIAMAMACYGLW